MDGSINFSGTLSGGINSGGGSDVTITPTLQSGEKIADYSINNVPGVLYAPTPVSLTAQLPLSISENVISIDLSDYATVSALGDYQEKLTAGNYINIDSNNEISCTPPITNVWYTPEPGVQQDVLIGKFTVNEVTQNVYAPSGGSSWNYSTSEVATGQKWIDGKDLYIRVIQVDNLAADTASQALITNVDFYTCLGITMSKHGDTASYSPSQISMYNYQGVGTMYAALLYDSTTKELKISNNSRISVVDATAIVMYTKSV